MANPTHLPIAIYYEQPNWFKPLFAELDRRGTPYVKLHAVEHSFSPEDHPEREYSIVFNRMSPSAWNRGHGDTIFYTLGFLDPPRSPWRSRHQWHEGLPHRAVESRPAVSAGPVRPRLSARTFHSSPIAGAPGHRGIALACRRQAEHRRQRRRCYALQHAGRINHHSRPE